MLQTPLLNRSLEASQVMDRNGYQYFIHPLTDGVPQIDPPLLREVTAALDELLPKNIDKIVGIEAMGLPVAVAVAAQRQLPLVYIRKRPYGLPGEVVVDQRTGYGGGKLYINGISKSDTIVIVDDVLSTGGTMDAILGGIRKIGAKVAAAAVVVDKSHPDTRRALEFKYEIKVISLAKIKIDAKGVRVL